MRATVYAALLSAFFWSAPSWALTPEVEFDLLLMQAIEDTESERYDQAFERFMQLAGMGEEVLEQVTENNPDTKDNMMFYLAKSALYSQGAGRRLPMLDLYLTEFGREGLHYREALELYSIGEELGEQAEADAQRAAQQRAAERNERQEIIDKVKRAFEDFTGESIDAYNTMYIDRDDGYMQMQHGDDTGNGLGMRIWYKEDGASYFVGNFRDGMFDGFGKFVYSSGAGFAGQWSEGSKVQGTFIYSDGAIYEGEFLNNKRHGEGRFQYASGAVYVGNHREDQRHGRGVMTYSNGDEYRGQWLNGKTNDDEGRLTLAGGNKYEGVFQNGEFVRGSYDGGYFVKSGSFKDGDLNGQGEIWFPEGNGFRNPQTCTGEFRAGYLVGSGSARNANSFRRCRQVGTNIEFY